MQYEATASLQVREPASFHLQARETALLHCPRTYVQAPTHTLSLGFSLSRAHTRPLPLSHFFPKIASILSDPPLPTLLSPFLPCLREFTHPASIHRLLCDVAQCNLSATRYIPPQETSRRYVGPPGPTYILQKRASQRYPSSPQPQGQRKDESSPNHAARPPSRILRFLL